MINQQWPQLNQFEYPGRFIILGRNETSYYAIYGVTARSSASRAKKYVFNRQLHTIHVAPTDAETMAEGNLDLLDYTAVRLHNNAIIIGNGKQVDIVKLQQSSAAHSLASSLHEITYEPDNHHTPRITGIIANINGIITHALHIVTADEHQTPKHAIYDLALQNAQGYFISTYAGPNIKPTPSFTSQPILLEVQFENAQDAVQQVYNYFAPSENNPDLRVSVCAIQTDLQLQEKEIAIINFNK